MTSDETPQDPYGGAPYSGPPATPPGYGQQGYPGYQQGYPYGGHQGGYPPAYGPPQPYPYGYPYPPPYPGYVPPRPGRPSSVTASAVLAFVLGGLLIAAALLLFAGASFLNDLGNSSTTDTDAASTEFTVDGFINLVAGGLLITGGVMIMGRNRTGRTMISTAAVIVLGAAIYWVVRYGGYGGIVIYAMLFSALAVISISMAFTGTARHWLGSRAAPSARPPS